MRKNNKKIILTIIMLIGILLLIFGFVINFNNKESKEPNNPDDARAEEKLANSILTELNINDYLRFVFSPNVVINENILDINSNQYMLLYFYADKNLTKYKLKTFDLGVTYAFVKYSEYVNEHKKVFGEEPVLDMHPDFDKAASLTFGIPNLPENIDGDYQISSDETMFCDVDESSDCFVVLIQDHVNSNSIEFSNLSIKDNAISGSVRMNSNTDDSKIYLDGTFEFEYGKNKNNYIAKSLKITSVANAYNSIENK